MSRTLPRVRELKLPLGLRCLTLIARRTLPRVRELKLASSCYRYVAPWCRTLPRVRELKPEVGVRSVDTE